MASRQVNETRSTVICFGRQIIGSDLLTWGRAVLAMRAKSVRCNKLPPHQTTLVLIVTSVSGVT